jgi:hypothetical protein
MLKIRILIFSCLLIIGCDPIFHLILTNDHGECRKMQFRYGSLSVRSSSLGRRSISFVLEIESTDSLWINTDKVKIYYNGVDVKYQYYPPKGYSDKNKLISVVNSSTVICYGFMALNKMTKADSVCIVADNLICEPDKCYDLKDCTFRLR